MIVNASARKIQLLIGGKDFSSCYADFVGSDSHLDQSGFVIFTGTLTLEPSLGFDESLDDRKNTRFYRGQNLVLNIANTSNELQRHPRGSLRILSAKYDDQQKPEKLTLQVGDLIALLNYRAPTNAEEDPGIEFGGNTTSGEVISRLLQKAGISAISGSLPNTLLNYPINLSGGYLATVGKILYANNRFGWIDKNEVFQVRAASISGGTPNLTINVGTDEIWYRRIEGAETPCPIIKAVGRLCIVRPTKFQEDVTEQYGSAITVDSIYSENLIIVVKRTIIKESYDPDQRILTTRTWTEMPIGLTIPETLIGNEFKLKLIVADQRIEKKYYEQGKEGKLLKIETESYQPRGVAIAEFVAAHPNIITSIYTQILMELAAETYKYDVKDRPSTISYWLKKVDGLILAGTDEDWKRWLFPPTNLVLAQLKEQKWTEINKCNWFYEWSSREPLVQIKPERVKTESGTTQGSNGPTSNKLKLIYADGERKTSTSGQFAPAAPERCPSKYQLEEEDIEQKVIFAIAVGDFIQRERTFTVEYLASENRPALGTGEIALKSSGNTDAHAQLEAIARREGNLLIGRAKGQEIATSVTDSWFDYHPLMPIQAIEPDGTSLSFLADGTSWAGSRTKFLVSTDAIWTGTWKLTPQGQVVSPLYQEKGSFTSGTGLGSQFNGYAWAFETVSAQQQTGIGLAAKWSGAHRLGAGLGLGDWMGRHTD